MGQENATAIFQELLDVTGKALLNGDFDSFFPFFDLPHTIETPDQKTVIKTEAALRRAFDLVIEDYRNRGITNLIRICEVAEFRGLNRIEAVHTSHLMAGNHRVVDPYPTFCVVERIGEEWLVTSSQYALDSQTTIGRAISIGGFDQTDTPTLAPGVSGAPKKREN